MKNQSVSDFVAATMDAVLNSKEHKSLFATQYKTASAKCSKCGSMHEDKDSCMADDSHPDPGGTGATISNQGGSVKFPDQKINAKPPAVSKADDSFADDDDNDARKKKKDSSSSSSDSSDADDDNDARKKKDSSSSSSDSSDADDDDNDARKKKDDSDDSSMADDGLEPSVAFDVAIDSLLTASAALDSVGLGRGSALTLKIASLVVEAKKKDKDSKKSKKDSKDSKKDSKKDSQSAKDKKSNPFKKKDDKKDDKKSDSKKPSSSSSSSKKK